MGLLLVALASAEVGARVQVSGVVTYTGSGPVRLEVLRVDEEGGPPLMLHVEVLPSSGPFVLSLPAAAGPVRLRAAHDVDGDGVGPTDPQVVSAEPLIIGVKDIEGVELAIRRPDVEGAPQSP